MTDRTLMPTDDSLVAVLARLAEAGWTVDHRLHPDATIECGCCGAQWSADVASAEVQHRVEGASDPDDLQLVVGLRCPTCSAQGRVTTGYGPGTGDDELAFLQAVDLDQASSPLADSSPDPAPGSITAMLVVSVDDELPAAATTHLLDLMPATTNWSVLGLLPPHPATATGATGFASPVLTVDQIEARAEQDERAGVERTSAVAELIGQPHAPRRLLRRDRMIELMAMLERESVDVVVTTSTSNSFWSFLTEEPTEALLDRAPCPVLVLPDADQPIEGRHAPATERDTTTVVVAVDDTALDGRLLDRTASLFGHRDRSASAEDRSGVDIVVAHVAPAQAAIRSIPLATGVAPATDGQMVAEALRRLDDDGDHARTVAEQTATDAGFDDAVAVGTVGPVVSGILGVADEHDADAIVVGTHDRSWFSRLIDPSVSAGVESRTNRPVLVVS